MPEVIFAGPDGRLEGRYHPQKDRDAPIASAGSIAISTTRR